MKPEAIRRLAASAMTIRVTRASINADAGSPPQPAAFLVRQIRDDPGLGRDLRREVGEPVGAVETREDAEGVEEVVSERPVTRDHL